MTVTDEEGNDITSEFDDQIVFDENTKTLTVTLGEIGEKQYRIQYKTEITNFEEGKNFSNRGVLTGDGVDGEKSSTRSVTPPDNTYSKSFRSINYQEKTIQWRLRVDPIKDPITELTITDTFPNDGLVLLPDSLEITLRNAAGNEETLIKDTDYILKPIEIEGDADFKHGFIIEFMIDPEEPLNNRITIGYKTSFDPEEGIITSDSQTLSNRAVF